MNTTQNTRLTVLRSPERRLPDRRMRATAASLALALALSGCAASATPPGVGPAAAAGPPPASSVSPQPEGASVAESIQNSREVLALGAPALTPRQSRVTVFGFRPADRTVLPPADSRWLAADIEFCMGPTVKSVVPIAIIRDEFGVQTESEQLHRPDAAYGAANEVFSEPGRTLVAEECLRGPVIFAVPIYDPARYVGLFIQGGVLRWDVAQQWERGR